MPSIQIGTSELPKFRKEQLDKLIRLIAEEAGEESKKIVQNRIQRKNAIASKDFFNSITVEFQRNRSRSLIVKVGSANPAALPMEEGMKPEFVPIPVLLRWMAHKGIGGGAQTAYFIQQKLLKEGYPARRIFAESEDEIIAKIDEVIEDILNREDIF